MHDIEDLKQRALNEIEDVSSHAALEEFRLDYLGRKQGKLTAILRSLKDQSEEERKRVGGEANRFKQELEVLIERKVQELKRSAKRDDIDITHPPHKIAHGHLHPLTKIERRIRQIFLSLNFSSVVGPEVDTEFHNFDALNVPQNHPAREMWDTLWLADAHRRHRGKQDKLLLRAHTSPMQIRYMLEHEPPFQIIVPGRVFRNEATDASHEINFHQLEGLMVGEDVSLANFMYVMDVFLKRLFNKKVETRYRPSYFPFVEPGLEIDIKLKGKWLEVAGAGMVHPNVFSSVNYDPRKVQGFAFGFGIDRLAMIKYGIDDIRLFYNPDLRFVNQPFK